MSQGFSVFDVRIVYVMNITTHRILLDHPVVPAMVRLLRNYLFTKLQHLGLHIAIELPLFHMPTTTTIIIIINNNIIIIIIITCFLESWPRVPFACPLVPFCPFGSSSFCC